MIIFDILVLVFSFFIVSIGSFFMTKAIEEDKVGEFFFYFTLYIIHCFFVSVVIFTKVRDLLDILYL